MNDLILHAVAMQILLYIAVAFVAGGAIVGTLVWWLL